MIAIFMLACCQLALRADSVTTTRSAYDIDPSNGANMSVTGTVHTSYDGVTEFLVKNSGKTYKITPVNNLNEPTTNIIAYNPGVASPAVNASDFRYSLINDSGSYLDRNGFNNEWAMLPANGETKTDENGNLSSLSTTLLYHQAYPNNSELTDTHPIVGPNPSDFNYAKGIQNGTIVNQIGRSGSWLDSMETNSVIFTYYTPIYGTVTSTFKADTQGPLGTVTLDGTATDTSISYNSIFKTAIAEVKDIDDDGNNYTYYNYYISCVVYDEPIDGTTLGYTSLGSYTNDYGTYYVLGMSTGANGMPITENDYNSANRILDGITVSYS